MKKAIFIIIFLMILLPSSALAGCVGNCGVSGGGVGSAGSGSGSEPCGNDAFCLSGPDWSGGVRLTLYIEKNNSYSRLGRGIDLLSVSPSDISDPALSDVLRDRLGNNCSMKSILWGGEPRMIKWSTYNSKYKYYSGNNYSYNIGGTSYNMSSAINAGVIADWLFNTHNKTGWLQDNLFDKMKKNTKVIADLFNLSNEEYKQVLTNGDNIYITAELLMTTYQGGRSFTWYTATVSEEAETIIYRDYIKHMKVSQSNYSKETNSIGKLVKDNGPIRPVEITGTESTIGYSKGGFASNGTVLCGKSWGMAIWYLKDCCEECLNSCFKACSDLEQGSAARGSCAVAWCNANVPDDVKTKSKSEQEKWIDECIYGEANTPLSDRCYVNQNASCGDDANKCLESSKNSMSKSNKCDELSDGSTVTLSSNICLDDKESYKTDSVNYSAGGYTVASKKLSTTYYKIDCNETANLSNLPEKRKIQFNSAGVANLYVGYKMNYSKKCTLKWLAKDGKTYVASTENINNYSIKDGELVNLDRISKLAKEKITTKLRSDQRALAVRLEEVKKIIEKKEYVYETDEQYYKNLEKYLIEELKQIQDEKVIDVAKIRLQNVAVQETSLNTNKTFSNTVGIEVSVGSSTTKEEKLEPVYCTSKVFSDVSSKVDEYPKVCPDGTRYVDTITTVTTTTTEESVCDNNNQKGIIITTSDGLKTNYSKSIFYALPSSYIEGDTDETGKVHHDLKECEDDVKPYNGLCVRKENVHTFNQNIELDNYGVTPNSGSVPFTLKVKNYGSCGQFNYTLSCEGDTVIEEQDCDELCGPNLQCRAIYCPNDCPACPEVDVETSSIDHKCISTACMNTCKDNYSDKNSEGYIHCEADCCRMENADKVQCCLTECDKLYKNGYIDSDGLAACRKDCPPDLGDDYIYRTVDMDNPFPERDPGKNWIGKQRDLSKYITDADKYSTDNSSKNKKYYDETNGFNGKYEYKIQLDSSLIKAIRNSNEVSTTYQDYERSKSTSSSIGKNIASNQNGQVYCSHLLNDSGAILYEANQKDNNISGGMGCK